MAKRKSKPLEKRLNEFEQLKVFSVESIAFNDHYHFRLLAPNGQNINYHPVSEKYQRNNRWYQGFSNLIEYLNEVS